jgi:anti-sigma factor RsiW
VTPNMDHTDATLSGAAERYILDEMDAQERERYEAHFFVCPECADEVRAAARFVDCAKPLLHGPADQLIAPVRTAVRDATPSWWSALLESFRPLPLAAAAALLLAALVGYQSLVLIPGLRQQLHDADGVQAAPAFFLSVARGEPPVIQVTPGDRRVSVTLSRTFDRAFPYYRVDVLDASGRTIDSRPVRGGAAGEELTVSIPVLGLPAGSYAIVVAGLESESSRTPASDSIRYPFKLEWRDAPR